MTRRIALVTQGPLSGGGLGTMTSFLYRVLAQSGRYRPEIISLATSASDSASVHLRHPGTWRSGVQTRPGEWRSLPVTHVGAWMSEIEFQRYRPRCAVTTLLQQYDAIQFVVGAPCLGYAAARVDRPMFLWAASTAGADRASRVRRGSVPRRLWGRLMTPLAVQYDRCALQNARVVFALSEYTRAAVRPMAGSGRVVLAPCGVDTELFHPGTPGTRPYILSVGRFSDERKNVRLLLDAYAHLHRRHPTLPDLYLVGEPPSEAARNLLLKLGIAEKVRLLGIRQGADLAALYRQALLFVLSSDEEGLAIVILEAMASALPVVSTDCGGPATAVVEGRTGFLTPVGDTRALAAAMERVLCDSSLRRSLGCAGRQRVEERFSLAVTGQVFLDTYDELLQT